MALHTSDIAVRPDHGNKHTNTPLLQASGLTLRLGPHTGVHNISLSLSQGDIVGLLGLNGAGKSTTLRLLSGILVPDEGSISINGYSLLEHPLQARAQIGYLPDQPPIYNDMRVTEYLTLAGSIRGLKGRTLNDRQHRVIEQCALGDVQTSLIGKLSKGYRQRVGMAQALIHEPAVVLLDEPSNGLDPKQMEGMRALIQEIAQNQAIIFSTHLLSEVKASCNRVAIIHNGRLVADQLSIGDDLECIFQGATT